MNGGTITAVLELNASGFSSGIQSAQQQLKTFSDSSKSAGDRLIGLGTGMSALGSTLTKGVTLPLVGIGTAAVKTAADFEAAMSQVQALSGATSSELEALSNKAKGAGISTKFSATESANAFSYMALAGWDAQQMLGGLDGVLNLAAASGMGLAEASDICTDYITAFGLQAEDATKVSDLFAYAQANSNTNVQQLAEAFGNCSVLASSYGYTMEEVTGALGLFANSGLKGSEAGTALNAVMRDIVNNMKDGTIAIGNTNVAVTDANGKFLSYVDIVKGVEKATQGMTDAEKAAALQKTFTAYSIKGINMLLSAGSEELANFTEELYNSEGAGKEMADTMQNNLQGKITAFKSALEGAGIAIGENLLPSLTKITEKITGVVQWFGKLDPGIQSSIVNFGLVAAAMGPVLSIGGKLITGIGGIVKGFGLLSSGVGTAASAMGGFGSAIGLLTGPIGIATGVIVAAVVAWKTNFAGFRDACENIFEDVGRIFNSIKEKASDLWVGIKGAWDNDSGGIQTMFTTALENVTTIFESAFTAIADMFDLFADAFEGDWEGVWENLFNITDGLMDGLQEGLSNSLDAMTTVLENWFPSLEGKLDGLPGVFNKIWDSIQEAMSIGIENIKLTFEAIGEIFQGDFGGAFDLFKNRWSEAFDAVVNKIASIKDAIGGLDGIKTKVAEIATEVGSKLADGFSNVKDQVVDKFSGIKEGITEKISGIKEGITSKFSEIKEGITSKISEIKETLSNLFQNIEIGDNILNIFKDIPNKIFEFGLSIPKKLLEGIQSAIGSAGDLFGNLFSGLQDAIDKIESKEVEIKANASGKEEVIELGQSIENTEGKEVEMKANTSGKEDVVELDQSIENTEGKDVNVDANVNGTSNVNELTNAINRVPISKNPNIRATTSGLGSLQTMKSTIDSINSKTVTISVTTAGTASAARAIGKLKAEAYATGTENANSGLATVAEYGPELIMSRSGASMYLATNRQIVNMEGGERVFNARQTSEILRSAAERNSTKNNSNIEKLLNEAITRLDRIKDATNNNSIEVTKAIENKELVSNVNLDSNSLAKGITPSVEKEQGNRMLLYKRGVLV